MIAVWPGRYVDAVSGLMFLVVVAVYCVLFARRVPTPKIQTYYLYFDRYLFSEVFPAALPLTAIGMRSVVDPCSRFVPNPKVCVRRSPWWRRSSSWASSPRLRTPGERRSSGCSASRTRQ